MIVYRLGKEDLSGVWYDQTGNFTGLIHTEFNFCSNSKLEMPFREEMVGKLSITKSINTLFDWFSNDDLLRLKDYGYKILIYKVDAEYIEFNEEFKHHLMLKDKCELFLSFNDFKKDKYSTISQLQNEMSKNILK